MPELRLLHHHGLPVQLRVPVVWLTVHDYVPVGRRRAARDDDSDAAGARASASSVTPACQVIVASTRVYAA